MALEERGFKSLWVAEHSHIPVIASLQPAPGGMELSKPCYDVMDPFVPSPAAAAVTKRLKLGTGVCLVIQRDTIQTAKRWPRWTRCRRAASCSVSAAAGTPRDGNHGTVFKTRLKLMRERSRR